MIIEEIAKRLRISKAKTVRAASDDGGAGLGEVAE
jgi:hypothetical protein